MVNLNTSQWIWILLGMSAVTLFARLVPILILGKKPLPAGLKTGLAMVPGAVLAAAIFPTLLVPGAHIDLSFSNVYLLAAGPTFISALLAGNLMVPVMVGMLTVSLLRYFN